MIIRHFQMNGVDIDAIHANRCQDGGSMCTDCEAQGQCKIETAPGDLDDTRSSVAGFASAVWTAAGVGCIGYVVGKALEWW